MSKRKPLTNTNKKRLVRPAVIILGDGPTEESYIKRLNDINYFSNVNLKYQTNEQ